MPFKDKNTGFYILDKRENLDFYHHRECIISPPVSAFHAYCLMTKDTSWWLELSFKIRDLICSLFSLKKIHGFSEKERGTLPKKGEFIDFFYIENITEENLLLAFKDKHLSVLVSLSSQKSGRNEASFSITTSVKTHNFLGKIYMVPVAPMHDIIVKKMMQALTEST